MYLDSSLSGFAFYRDMLSEYVFLDLVLHFIEVSCSIEIWLYHFIEVLFFIILYYCWIWFGIL